MWKLIIKRPLIWAGTLLAAIGLLAVACTSGVPANDNNDLRQQLSEKDAALTKAMGEVAQLKQQLESMAPSTVVQAGQLQPAPAGAQPSGWDTAESIRGGPLQAGAHGEPGAPGTVPVVPAGGHPG